jgi:hypothetical protein
VIVIFLILSKDNLRVRILLDNDPALTAHLDGVFFSQPIGELLFIFDFATRPYSGANVVPLQCPKLISMCNTGCHELNRLGNLFLLTPFVKFD